MSEWKANIIEENIKMIKNGLKELEKGNADVLKAIRNRFYASELMVDDDELSLILLTTALYDFLEDEISNYSDGKVFAKKVTNVLSEIINSYESKDKDKLYNALLSYVSMCRERRKQTEFRQVEKQ